MREIVFDTETTGLDPRNGDRIIEIGGVELFNHFPTGKTFHRYVNPERAVQIDAIRVHGLDDAFLKDKPRFAEIIDEMLEFFGEAPLIAHNAVFDLDFLNAELTRAGRNGLPPDRVVDTLMLARRRHPAGPNSLDALLARYSIDASKRTFHGALLDAQLLSEVYIELIGGRQANLILDEQTGAPSISVAEGVVLVGERLEPRLFRVTEEEMAAHRIRIATMGPDAIWLAYLDGAPAMASQATSRPAV